MFIDYVTVMLINMVAAFLVLAAFVVRREGSEGRSWAHVFFIVGLVAVICGLAMVFTWPLPGPYNAAFGEPSVMLGVLFIGASIALFKDFDLSLLGYYSAVAGIVAIVIGARIIHLELTRTPVLSGVGFILSGVCGVAVGPYFVFRNQRWFRLTAMLFLLVPALIWLRTALSAYWDHLESFGNR